MTHPRDHATLLGFLRVRAAVGRVLQEHVKPRGRLSSLTVGWAPLAGGELDSVPSTQYFVLRTGFSRASRWQVSTIPDRANAPPMYRFRLSVPSLLRADTFRHSESPHAPEYVQVH